MANSDIEGLKLYINGKVVELKNEMRELEHKIELNEMKIDMLQHNQTLCFILMCTLIVIAVIVASVRSLLLEMLREKRQEERNDEILRLVRSEIAKLKTNTGEA